MAQPNRENTQALQTLAQMSPEQIQKVLQNQQQLQDRSMVRSVITVQPRPASLGPPGNGLAMDTTTGGIELRPTTTQPNVVNKYFASQVSMYDQPQKLFAPTVARVTDQLQNGHDLIAITYSFDLNSGGDNSLKYVVFSHALQELFPRIQSMTRNNGNVTVQLVQIIANEERRDLLAGQKSLRNACTYTTCGSTEKTINNVRNATMLIDEFKSQFNTPAGVENHIVMTLSSPGSKGKIHIADVLFQNMVPPIEDIKLLDSSWITYLSDVIQDPEIKIDLFFNVLPFAANDNQTSTANDRLLQVSGRIQNFLSQLHAMT
jgi:hypothetical protein